MKIAVCDDSKEICQHITHILSSKLDAWNEAYDIQVYSSGEELCKALKSQSFELIFLDIMMGGMDGVATAQQIREFSSKSLICFVSSSDDRLKELFAKNVIGFIDKPIDTKRIQEVLQAAIQHLKVNQQQKFVFKKNGKTYSVAYSDIIYFESIQHNIELVTKDTRYIYRGRLYDVWESLQKQAQFCMPSRSFIVNMSFVSYSKSELVVSFNQLKITIGRKYKEETMQRFMSYLHKKGESN